MAGRIAGVGFDARPEDVVTAGEVALDIVCRRHYGAPVYLLGTAALGEAARARGIRLVLEAEAEQAAVVLVARDPGFGQAQLEAACRAIWRGARFYAVALDRVIPVEGGFIPGTGALVKAIQHATTRRPMVLGKPSPWPLRAALARMSVSASRTVYVGDSATSDVAMGKRAGCRTVLVLSGSSDRPAARTPPRLRPDAVLDDVTQLRNWVGGL
jgi:4-nitrophenyl phosphatase